MKSSYLFGGDTGWTYEELQRRRAIADKLAEQVGTPRNIGEGLAAIGKALMVRGLNKRAGQEEARMKGEFDDAWAKALGGSPMGGGGGSPYAGASYEPPAPATEAERVGVDTMAALGKNPEDVIRAGLKARGMPDHIAEGFIMNFKDESGLNPNINEAAPVVPGSRGGFGLSQWTGPRRVALENFAAERGKSVGDTNTQLDFLMSELQGPEARAARSIYATNDAGSAAAAIAKDFLRPAKEHLDRRVARYTGNAPMDMTVSAQNAPQTSGAGMADAAAWAEVMSSPFASPGQRAIAQAMLSRALQPAQDPMEAQMRNLELERAQLEIDALRNPQPKDTRTDDMREYDFAKAQGFEGSFTDFMTALRKAGASSVNVNGESVKPLGTEGQILVVDENAPGGYRIEVAPGSKMDREIKEAEAANNRAAAAAAQNELTRGNVVSDTAKEIRSALEKGGMFNLPEVGIVGKAISGINQEAADVGGMLDTLKGMVVFDRLEKLRQASATGASGLGQVTEREIALLGAQLGALDQGLSKERILATLDTVESVFQKLSPAARDYLMGAGQDLPEWANDTPPAAPAAGEPTGFSSFEEFSARPGIQEAAKKYGVTVEEMWETYQEGQ